MYIMYGHETPIFTVKYRLTFHFTQPGENTEKLKHGSGEVKTKVDSQTLVKSRFCSNSLSRFEPELSQLMSTTNLLWTKQLRHHSSLMPRVFWVKMPKVQNYKPKSHIVQTRGYGGVRNIPWVAIVVRVEFCLVFLSV